jgi:hypothetical protein
VSAFDTATGGLDLRVRELTDGNAYHPQPRFQPLGPYRETEWDRLTRTCRTIVDDAYATHRQAVSDAERGCDPRVGGWDHTEPELVVGPDRTGQRSPGG